MKICDIFHVLLLKQNIIRKKRVNKLLKLELKFDIGENKKKEVVTIKNNVVYTKAIADQ